MAVPAVVAHDLGRRFGDVVAVADVSFEVAAGEWFALLGPNGAGKSTTLSMLTTMLKPGSGWAQIMGFDVLKQSAQVRASIGMVFQEPALDERLSARENLQIHAYLHNLPRRSIAPAITRALDWAGLQGTARRAVRTFSGGMKRRLELARTLMHEPKVLFMDEPSLGLDTQGRRDLWNRIAELREHGMTVIMTTHYLPEAEACDRIGIMDEGRLVAVGTPEALKQEVLEGAPGTLEDVFLKLTGRTIRPEEASARDRLLGFAGRGG